MGHKLGQNGHNVQNRLEVGSKYETMVKTAEIRLNGQKMDEYCLTNYIYPHNFLSCINCI